MHSFEREIGTVVAIHKCTALCIFMFLQFLEWVGHLLSYTKKPMNFKGLSILSPLCLYVSARYIQYNLIFTHQMCEFNIAKTSVE